MEYRVKIHPAKEREFLQLLKAWESLGVVLSYELIDMENADADAMTSADAARRRKRAADAAWEMAEPYKDLLD